MNGIFSSSLLFSCSLGGSRTFPRLGWSRLKDLSLQAWRAIFPFPKLPVLAEAANDRLLVCPWQLAEAPSQPWLTARPRQGLQEQS